MTVRARSSGSVTPPFAFDPAAEERALPGVVLVLERAPSDDERRRIEAALPRVLVGLFSFEWRDARVVIVADDVFLWDDFPGAAYPEAIRALATAVHRVVPVTVVASDAQRDESDEALRARAVTTPVRDKPPRSRAKSPAPVAPAHADEPVPRALEPFAVPWWREAMARLEAAEEGEVVRAARVCPDVKARGKPLSSLTTKAAILAVLRDPGAAKVGTSQLGVALGAPVVMVAELDVALGERLGLALLDGTDSAFLVRSAARALAGSTRDDVLARLVARAVQSPWCRDGLVSSRHPRATEAVLAEAEALLDPLTPRAVTSGADHAPPEEEARSRPASTLIDIACVRDPEAARARFVGWRAQGGVRTLAAIKGLLSLLPASELAATGLVPFALAMFRVNDPALEAYAKWAT